MRPFTAIHVVKGKRFLSRRALKLLGWPAFVVSRYMPEPDLVIPNPYRRGETMPLYLENRVRKLEARHFERFSDGGILIHLPVVKRN